MRIEFAPMEGITTYTYRNTFAKYYGGVETYFSPFISTHKEHELNYKELADINPDNNIGINLIPQVLTADADEFFYTASQITAFGYDHINLNFGCPSGTVTSKGKGSGTLIYPEKLERLLDAIFSKTDLKISVKTRMGFAEYEEWDRLLKIYTKFPLEELIIHARIREDYYRGQACLSSLASSLASWGQTPSTECDGGQVGITSEYDGGQTCVTPSTLLSYNGDIFTKEAYKNAIEAIPCLDAVMLGRGLIANPELAQNIKVEENLADSFDLKKFKEFNLELAHNYQKIMSGDRNTLFKLKEIWTYMIKTIEILEMGTDMGNTHSLTGTGMGNTHPLTGTGFYDFTKPVECKGTKKLLKSIRKCNSVSEYERIIKAI